ncbi:2-iminobutanoate/2-iminopropanoate deaminase [Paraburkholderia sp. EB58]|jgi:2-iminobutanoate/2-iminopropanoate deaminase|uniref:RidA family protein n=1 Tax=Paraburkholderia sp. EB58 TaxID=3035125 RepID=UPI003D23E265
MPIERVKSPLQSNLPISNAIRAGKNIFTSQVPRVPSTGEILSDGDIGKQARQTFENLKVVMESAGGSLANVVQLTIFLVEAEDAAEMNRAYREYFAEPFPNRATVVVKALLVEGMAIELTAQGYVDNQL